MGGFIPTLILLGLIWLCDVLVGGIVKSIKGFHKWLEK